MIDLKEKISRFKFTASISVLSILMAISCVRQAKEGQSQTYAGVSKANITPPVGYPHYRGTSTGIHDSLYARAVVFRQGDRQVALVECDLLWVTRPLSINARSLIAERTNIPYSNIIVAATHTHTSPAYNAGIKELNERLQKVDKSGSISIEGMDYRDWLGHQIAKAVTEASRRAVSAELAFGKGRADDISFNRRYIMKNGKVRTNPGVGNPNAIKPVGPIDPEVGMIILRGKYNNVPFGGLINFADHADTFGGTIFSADFPGFLARTLAKDFNKDFVTIYAQGACGDINHINIKNETQLTSEQIGKKLAVVVKKKISNLNIIDHPQIKAKSEFVYAPLQQYSKEELKWAKDKNADPLYKRESALLQRRRPMKIRLLEKIRKTEGIPPTVEAEPWTVPLEIQVFKISDDVAIVGLPGEDFVELGLAIKKASPFKGTMVVELTNSFIAYVPTRRAFSQGSYETVNSRLAPGGGEMMVNRAIKMLNELK